MSSDASFMQYVADQCARAGGITFKRMFGEYALYCDAKVVAFVCDNQFFLKPIEAVRPLLGALDEAPAYPGSKLYWRLTQELEDAPLLARIVRASADAQPAPKPKAPKKPRVPGRSAKS
ncbi:MAG TPA: TfoX/Sxy family protein [Burkholderiaceae bacterium]|jgi:TfoX/Sxy family transcriptional regulator of competence genes|nr:TfoX/Sxy family protein [Burkholderiaceae bacterium]